MIFGLPVSQLSVLQAQKCQAWETHYVCHSICTVRSSKPELKQCIKKTAEMSEVWDEAKITTVTSYLIINKITRLHME